jgi:hypothetical protein
VLQQLPVVALRGLSKEPGQLTQVPRMQAGLLRSKRRSKGGAAPRAMTTKKKVAPKKVVAKKVAPTLKLPLAPAMWRKPARARSRASTGPRAQSSGCR